MTDRALKYVLAMPPSVAGRGGHDAAFAVACALVQGFDLREEDALAVMRAWNQQAASPPWAERELIHKVQSAMHAPPSQRGRGYLLRGREDGKGTACPPGLEGVAPKPLPPGGPRIPAFDPKALGAFVAGFRRTISPEWLRERSPVPLPAEDDLAGTQKAFLETGLFDAGETVLIFSRYYSQGDFAHIVGRGSMRLGDSPGSVPVPSALPTAGREGLWCMAQPVDGTWHIAAGARPGERRWSRRSGSAVTSWRFLLLESDVVDPGAWLRVLVQLRLAVAAVYTSGGRSVHALIRLDASSQIEFDSCRDLLRAVLCPLGADGRAMTAVRLTRLPGTLRRGARDPQSAYTEFPEPRLQRLLWLNPTADGRPICELAK